MGDESLYNVTIIDGLDSLPDVTIGIAPKPRRHGSWLVGKLAQKRIISMSFDILGDPEDDYRTTRPKNALVNAMQLMDEELPLIFEMDYGEEPVLVYASVTALDLPLTKDYSRLRSGTIEFTCTDPKKYSTEAKVRTTATPTTPEAAAYGQPYGFAYSVTTGLSGTFKASNTGNSPTPVVYKITGPVTRPKISLSDKQGVRATVFNLTLTSKQRLEINTATNSVKRNGSDVYGSAVGALIADLTLRPGDTTVSFTGDNTGGAVPPTLTAEWRDATH
jgi:hypothetical protein